MTCQCGPCKKEATEGNRCYECALQERKGCQHCGVCRLNISSFTPTGRTLHMANHHDPVKTGRAQARYVSSFRQAEASYERFAD